MTIEFKEDQIFKREQERRNPYIGYFAPDGKLIDYNILLGGSGHDDWNNPVSWAFLSWISYIIKDTSIEELKEWANDYNMVINNQYLGIDELVKRGYGIDYDFNYETMEAFLETLNGRINYIEDLYKSAIKFNYEYDYFVDDYTKFEYKLLLFFRNAYKNGKFFESIQRKITIENPKIIKEKLRELYSECNLSMGVEREYRNYLTRELLSYFKDICVQYLGYDSIERFKPNGTKIKIPYYYEDYNYDFLANPRVITSSYLNINERYYNYLLMNWEVHRLPRYNYNEKTGIYEKESEFFTYYQSEKERNLEFEIKNIKKLVPIKERYKYFR